MTNRLSDDPRAAESLRRYWRQNVTIMLVLLAVWATVSLVCSILLADVLNEVRIGGFPLGFWFAQQGSIVTFVLLILTYALLLNRLDNKHARELREIVGNGDAARGGNGEGV